jgi:hypothetical protein
MSDDYEILGTAIMQGEHKVSMPRTEFFRLNNQLLLSNYFTVIDADLEA